MAEQKHEAHIEKGRRVMANVKETMQDVKAYLDEYVAYYSGDTLQESDFCTVTTQGDPPVEVKQGAHCDIIADLTRKDTYVNAVAVLQTMWTDWDNGPDTTIEKATR